MIAAALRLAVYGPPLVALAWCEVWQRVLCPPAPPPVPRPIVLTYPGGTRLELHLA